ncbi:MAG: hypothetical protein VYE68_05215, partial [Acidobacteriota bacterium]|nr:hypothetical protein [Acidobacteriota bacterium]
MAGVSMLHVSRQCSDARHRYRSPGVETYTIVEDAQRTSINSAGVQLWGPSGVGIWATPTRDPDRNTLYVATGDSYSHPEAATSDAIMALAMDTGEVRWSAQMTPGDVWNAACLAPDADDRGGCPDDAGPDYDFGSAVVRVAPVHGQSVLLAGQESGLLYRLDPDTGDVQWETRVGDGGILGGIEWGFATDGEPLSPKHSKRRQGTPAVSRQSSYRTARLSGTHRPSRTPVARGSGAIALSRGPSRRFLVCCSQEVSTVTCAHTTPRPTRSSGISTR